MSSEYRTSDLYEASAIALFVKPVELEKAGNFFLFVFKDGKAKAISKLYSERTLTVNATDFVDSVNKMKDWLFSTKRKLEAHLKQEVK